MLVGGAAAWPLVARAQQAVPVIGLLRRTDLIREDFAGFRDGLSALGYQDGRTIRIEQRYASGNMERLRAYARELAGLDVAVFVVDGVVTVEAVMAETKTIPIVAAILSEPERLGIENLNRPRGNVTGLSNFVDILFAKRLELLKEMIPYLHRVAVLRNPVNVSPIAVRVTEQAAAALGLVLRNFDAAGREEWPAAFAAIAEYRPDALVLFGDATFASDPKELADFALARKLPTVSVQREFVAAGGLVSYCINFPNQWRRAARYVDRILKGARPGDLPIEQPTKFELVINLKTARALGLTIPPAVLIRADEVIE